MRIAIIGSNLFDYNYRCDGRSFNDILDVLLRENSSDDIVILEEGSSHIGKMCREWCESNDVLFEEYMREYDDISLTASHRLNNLMIERCDACIVFNLKSDDYLQVLDAIELSKSLNKPYTIFTMSM